LLCTRVAEGLPGVIDCEGLHSARLEEYHQQSHPEMFGMDTVGWQRTSLQASVGMASGACHLFKHTQSPLRPKAHRPIVSD